MERKIMTHGSPPRTGAESDDLYRAYFDALPCYVTVLDRNLRILEGNALFT